ncbi:MAG: beta-propeller domain-containing protein, partial [Deltaproteobacteria bacterium]
SMTARNRLRFYSFASALLALGCGKAHPTGPGSPPNPIGATDYTSQPPRQSGGVAMAGGAAGAPNANGASTSGGTGGSAPSRAIQEADIYKVSGNTLFVLNQYRGLQIVDVTNPAAPQLVGKVPVVGNPIDLYVEGNTAYVLVSDYFDYWFGGDPIMAGGDLGGAITPWVGSQLWTVDVTQPANPQVLSTLPIEGEVSDTRIVGNVLYVVSNVYSWEEYAATGAAQSQDLTYVASFDVTNPAAPKAVQRLDFPASGWDIHANVTQSRIVLSESGWDQNSQGPITQFQPIDISDPAGALVLGQGYQAAGMVQNRWAMDFDPGTNLFRAVLQSQWGNSGGSLQIWSAPTVQSATPTGSLALNLPEAVTAASFQGSRAYIVTAYCTDPLWIADTTDPTKPVLEGSVSMSGELDFILPEGNQLLALGHDGSGCNLDEGGAPLAVSLFDVTDPTKPALTSRVDFGSGYTMVGASADDMKKVFQVLPQQDLILVPFQSWDQSSWQYKGGTQLIDYLSSGLTLRGFAAHAGQITRAFPVGANVVAISDRSLQVLDIQDRDNPFTVSQLDLARPVLGLSFIGGQAVELSGDYALGDTELAVVDPSTPDQATPSAVVSIPAPNARVFQDGNIAWILANDYTDNAAWLQAVDLTNPTAPVLRGKLPLDPAVVPAWYGGWWSWGFGGEAVQVGHALVLHPYYYGCYGCYGPATGSGSQPAPPPDQLFVVDLTNPDAPTLGSPLVLPNSDWSWGLTAQGSYAWITHYEWLPNSNGGQVRYYLDRLDVSKPSAPSLLPKINVPGVFFSASTDGQTVYTQDFSYSSDWSIQTTWLEKLSLLSNGLAQLDAVTPLNGSPGGAVVSGQTAYVETWSYGSGQGQTNLTAVDLGAMAAGSTQTVASQWASILGAAGGKLFLQTSWDDSGILIYDLSKPTEPSYQTFFRSEGWPEQLVVQNGTAYLPSGDYGVPMVSLSAGIQ